MKGTDVSDEDIRNAEEFLKVSGNYPTAERFITNRDDFIRLLAWYGRLRRDGDGKGQWVSKKRGTANEQPPDAWVG